MEPIIGEKRRTKRKTKRKTKTKVKIVVHTDAIGKYVLINGVKFRVGKDVTNPNLAQFVVNKAIKEPKQKRTGKVGAIISNLGPPINFKKKGKTSAKRPIDSYIKPIADTLTSKKHEAKDRKYAANDILLIQDKLNKDIEREKYIREHEEQKKRDKEEIVQREESSGYKGADLRNKRKPELYVIAQRLQSSSSDKSGISKLNKDKLIEYIERLTNPQSVKLPQAVPEIPPQSISIAPAPSTAPKIPKIPSKFIPVVPKTKNDKLVFDEGEIIDDSDDEHKEDKEDALNADPLDIHTVDPKREKLIKKLQNEHDLDASNHPEISTSDLENILEDPFQWPYTLGNGRTDARGLSNFQIDEIMRKYPEYLGTISHDEVKSRILPKVTQKSRGGFVINTDPERKPGEHWQAVFWDARPNGDHEIDFFDSYGDPIDKSLQKDLLLLANRLNAGTYLKFKENRVTYQNDKSSNCGWFAVKFLMDRFRGRPFSDASGWNDTVQGEKNIERFKTHHGGRFGYIPSFHEGGLSFPALRTDYPPKVRKYLTETPITSISICRKPIRGAVNTLLNIVSFGGWQKALKTVGIDKALHLYMILNNNIRLERNHVIEMKPGGKEPESQCMDVPLTHPITFKELLEKTAKSVGPSLQVYDSRSNNCQVFLTQVLRANGLLNSTLNTFINQDVKSIFENLPAFVGNIAKVVTDTAHRADVVVNGQKRIIREVPGDPIEKKSSILRSVNFDKEFWTPVKAETWLDEHDLSSEEGEDRKYTMNYWQNVPMNRRRASHLNEDGMELVLE